MEFIKTDKAPKAVGPYSQAVRVGKILFVSGQIALDPKTGKLVSEDIKEQTLQVLKNIEAILEEAGFKKTDVVKVTIYTTQMEKFSEINGIYEYFFGQHKPARATVGVKALPLNAKVEIEVIAVKEN